MKDIICPRCGMTIAASRAHCPLCGTALGNPSQPTHNKAQRRFIVWFVLLTLFCLALALWLPR